MSAPPDSRTNVNMSGQGHPEQHRVERQIPIFVEGRDEPVINTFVDNSTHFADTKPTYPTNIDRDQYFTNDGPTGIHHPPNMQKSFGTFNKAYKQPFSQQKMYPQSAAGAPNRGASPQRTQSPHRPDAGVPHPEQQPADKRPQQPQQQHQQPNPPPSSQSPPPPQNTTPPKPQPPANDPITQILAIQTDVLNLMTDVEKFTGNKKDKNYLYLDEMLTRNLIKLDLIETDGKENIRTARKEAIRCIQKCIAVLEAKAEKASQEAAANEATGEKPNGEVDMKDVSEEPKAETSEPPPQEGTAGPQAQPPADTVAAAPPQETRTDGTEHKVHGSRNKKPTDKREKSKENTDQMQVEETLEQPAVPMEQDVPSQ